MTRTTVKVYLRGNDGQEDYFVTPINLTAEEARQYYLDKDWNMGIEADKMMKCYKVEILKEEQVNF